MNLAYHAIPRVTAVAVMTAEKGSWNKRGYNIFKTCCYPNVNRDIINCWLFYLQYLLYTKKNKFLIFLIQNKAWNKLKIEPLQQLGSKLNKKFLWDPLIINPSI